MGTVSKDVFLLAHKHSGLRVCRLMGDQLNPETGELSLKLASSSCINILASCFGVNQILGLLKTLRVR
jgi:hypothetical protein